jgi:hypothetical protein
MIVFAYFRLIEKIATSNKVYFEEKLREVHANEQMTFVIGCLIVMLLIEILVNANNSITSNKRAFYWQGWTFAASMLSGIILIWLGALDNLAEWLKLWIIFLIFAISVFFHKASSIVERIRENEGIKKTEQDGTD